MATYRAMHDKDYTCISNPAIRDKKLSFKARGLHHLLLSYPDGWEINSHHLASESDKDGRDAVRSALKELEEHGYIRRKNIKDPKTGKFTTSSDIYELSSLGDRDGLSGSGKSGSGLSGVGNPGDLISTVLTSTDQEVSIKETSFSFSLLKDKEEKQKECAFSECFEEEKEKCVNQEEDLSGSLRCEDDIDRAVNPTESGRDLTPRESAKKQPRPPIEFTYSGDGFAYMPMGECWKTERYIATRRLQFMMIGLASNFDVKLNDLGLASIFSKDENRFLSEKEFFEKVMLIQDLRDFAVGTIGWSNHHFNYALESIFRDSVEWCKQCKDLGILWKKSVYAIFDDSDLLEELRDRGY